eukprot:gene10477-8440_t
MAPIYSTTFAAYQVLFTATTLLVVSSLSSMALAHQPYFENQRLRTDNFRQGSAGDWAAATPDEDFSLETPFDILAESALPEPGPPGTKPTPREFAALFVESLLSTSDDSDYFMYNKTTPTEIPFVGWIIVPACKVYKTFAPSVALIGPLGTRDSRTGDLIFAPVIDEDAPYINVPPGYGAKLMHQTGMSEHCIERVHIDPACAKSNVIANYIDTPGVYYWVVFDPKGGSEMSDYALVTGTVDGFTAFDFQRLHYILPFISHGRTLHKNCTGYLV